MPHMKKPFKRNSKDNTFTAVRELSHHDIVDMAKELVQAKFKPGTIIKSPADTEEYLRSQLGDGEEEVFACLFLDNRHRVLSFQKLFFGTIDGTSVYPRVVVKRTLALNAAAVILAHNHPSGVPEPSQADERITQRLKAALDLIDVRVLDHVIVGHSECVSLAKRGLL